MSTEHTPAVQSLTQIQLPAARLAVVGSRALATFLSGFVSHQRRVPKGTVMLRGVHDETYIAVVAYLRSLACK